MSSTCSAVVLAAGRSARMGRDKALLPVDGRPLWQRQAEVLRQAGAQAVIFSVRPEQTWVPAEAIVVRDAVPNAGPLAGIVAALEHTSTAHLMVLAVDLPRLPAAWFTRLLAECRPGVGAVGQRDDFFEPLAAIYPRESLPMARQALAAGEFGLQRLIARAGGSLRIHTITPLEAPWFANWNAPADAPPAQE